MIIPSKFQLSIAGTVLALLVSCSDFPEIPYSERITISSSENTSSSEKASSSENLSSSEKASSSSSALTFKDKRDNATYTYMEIAGEAWMSQNLNFASMGVCYDNLESNCKTYGRLYTLEEAKEACPSDWHLPTNKEWNAVGLADLAALHGGYRNGTALSAIDIISNYWWSFEGYYYSIIGNEMDSEEDSPEALNSVRCVRDKK